MNKTNLLQQLAPIGVAAIAATAGSILVAPSASAQSICYEGSILGVPDSVQCEDKLFDNFELDALDAAINNLTPGPGIGELTIENDGIFDDLGTYLFAWESTEFLVGTEADNFSYSYEVEITEPELFFDFIDVDTEVNPASDIVLQKEVTILDALNPDSIGEVITISSVQGDAEIESIAALQATELAVTDTVLFGSLGTPGVDGQGSIEAGENSFNQSEAVPEPATILGLLAVGGLGLGLKRKK